MGFGEHDCDQSVPGFWHLPCFTIHFLGKEGRFTGVKQRWTYRFVSVLFPSGLWIYHRAVCWYDYFLFNHAILKHIGDNGVVTYTIITYIYLCIMMTFTGISPGGCSHWSAFTGGRRRKHLPFYSCAMPVTLHVCDVNAGAGNLSVYDAGSTVSILFDFIDVVTSRVVHLHPFMPFEFILCAIWSLAAISVCSGYFAAVEKSGYSFAYLSCCAALCWLRHPIWTMGELFQGWRNPGVQRLYVKAVHWWSVYGVCCTARKRHRYMGNRHCNRYRKDLKVRKSPSLCRAIQLTLQYSKNSFLQLSKKYSSRLTIEPEYPLYISECCKSFFSFFCFTALHRHNILWSLYHLISIHFLLCLTLL